MLFHRFHSPEGDWRVIPMTYEQLVELAGNYYKEEGVAQETRASRAASNSGGARASLVPILFRCSRIFLTTGGSVMNETRRI